MKRRVVKECTKILEKKKKKEKKQLAQTLTMLSVVFGSLTPVGGVT